MREFIWLLLFIMIVGGGTASAQSVASPNPGLSVGVPAVQARAGLSAGATELSAGVAPVSRDTVSLDSIKVYEPKDLDSLSAYEPKTLDSFGVQEAGPEVFSPNIP